MKIIAGMLISASSKAFPKLLSLSPAHLAHDLGTIDQKEKGTSLVDPSSSIQTITLFMYFNLYRDPSLTLNYLNNLLRPVGLFYFNLHQTNFILIDVC
ncbi:hypothetical protein PPACK8108_LOCUS6668 [Phakopsora pachyrhizi]|uniref:Uncharacterized protein n=1 Tax=Phakopsora pachyrhizi TaxID=170000 RepID=A0AAV0AU93_PHAPC|nr:hypothetical protein PPACK8108_LOCUS6668 [Phakopsora pachyrhizi]